MMKKLCTARLKYRYRDLLFNKACSFISMECTKLGFDVKYKHGREFKLRHVI